MFWNFFKQLERIIFPQSNYLNKKEIYQKINKNIYLSKKKEIVFFSYRDKGIKKVIWNLKFKANPPIVAIFSEIIYENIIELLKDLEISENFYNPLIIIIPSTKWKTFTRGYNQNNLVIKKLIKKLPQKTLYWEKNNLIKIKNTKAQSKIKNKQKRLENIKGSFAVKKAEKIKNRNIIIFDDITTTGATLKEASRVLKKAGAKKIIFMTLAH